MKANRRVQSVSGNQTTRTIKAYLHGSLLFSYILILEDGDTQAAFYTMQNAKRSPWRLKKLTFIRPMPKASIKNTAGTP